MPHFMLELHMRSTANTNVVGLYHWVKIEKPHHETCNTAMSAYKATQTIEQAGDAVSPA